MAQDVLTFALGIPHTPWKPERVESLARLHVSLGGQKDEQPIVERVFAEKEANYVWAEKLWQWAAVTDATHLVQLQDDAVVYEDFWGELHRMVAGRPHDVIGLEAAHPHGPNVEGCWYTTSDMLIGVGYVLPIPELQTMLEWRDKLRKGAVESLNEDQLLGLWCFATGRKIWHPVPTVIDHDIDIPSTYGNSDHPHRRPTVTWRERAMPDDWHVTGAPDFGRFYRDTPKLARRWVPGVGEEELSRWSE